METSKNESSLETKDSMSLEAQRETFVASISHDLKNPTIAQIRALELFIKGKFGKTLPQQQEVLEMLLGSCKYMYAMLGSLLFTYREDEGTIKLSNDMVSIPELAIECIEEMIYIAKEKGVNIIFHNEADNGTATGDRVQLKRVVMNLLSNGIKYADKNSAIITSVYNDEKYICFKFENHSPYLDDEKRRKIFARYVSFAQKNKALGVGLGLYASKKIIEAHEGKIFVESFLDNRNVFGFKIPNKTNKKERAVQF